MRRAIAGVSRRRPRDRRAARFAQRVRAPGTVSRRRIVTISPWPAMRGRASLSIDRWRRHARAPGSRARNHRVRSDAIGAAAARIPQTNASARSMPLLRPACPFLAARFGMPLRLREIGASARPNSALRPLRLLIVVTIRAGGNPKSALVLRNRTCIRASGRDLTCLSKRRPARLWTRTRSMRAKKKIDCD